MQWQSQTQQGRDAAQFQLRLPEDLKARIQTVADASGRSLNSEIVIALLEKFAPDELAARAAATLLAYLRAEGNELEQETRAAELARKLRSLDAGGNVEVSEADGQFSVRLTR